MMKKRKILNSMMPIITILILLLVWFVVGVIVNNDYLFPSLSAVFTAFFGVVANGGFYSAYFATLLRSVIAFLISFLLAFVVALLSKKYKLFASAVSPIIKIIRALPTIAVVLLLLFWTNSLVAPVIVTMLVVFPTTYINIKESLSTVDDAQIEACQTFGVSQKEIFFKVQLPQIAPSMLDAVGAGLSLNLKLMVAAEVLSATYISLGNILKTEKYNAEIANMLAVVLVCVITGLLIELVFGLISKKVGKWQ